MTRQSATQQPVTQQPLPQQPASVRAVYDIYAAGLQIARAESTFELTRTHYEMTLAYHTTGMAGFFFHGHQEDTVSGTWRNDQPEPIRFVGQGNWRGRDRLAVIDYQNGEPLIRQLVPPNTEEREPVPAALQDHSIDTLSAMMALIRIVMDTGRCETTVRTYDGRRAVEIQARTVDQEMLPATSRSSYTGPALRCDFQGRMLAGFLFDDDRERDSKPMHGSAWLASLSPGGPLLPVRMSFETRWFGDATMLITTQGGAAIAPRVAAGH